MALKPELLSNLSKVYLRTLCELQKPSGTIHLFAVYHLEPGSYGLLPGHTGHEIVSATLSFSAFATFGWRFIR